MPIGRVEAIRTPDLCFSEVLLQNDGVARRMLTKGMNERLRVRNNDHLAAFGCANHQPSQRGQQVGMKARFRLVQYHELRWPRCEKRGNPQKIAESAVRDFSHAQRPQEPALRHLQGKSSGTDVELQLTIREGILDRGSESVRITDLADGLNGSGEV